MATCAGYEDVDGACPHALALDEAVALSLAVALLQKEGVEPPCRHGVVLGAEVIICRLAGRQVTGCSMSRMDD